MKRKIVFEQDYRDPGQRGRASYHLTVAGYDLALVVVAKQEWSNKHTQGNVPELAFRAGEGSEVCARCVDDAGLVVQTHEVQIIWTAVENELGRHDQGGSTNDRIDLARGGMVRVAMALAVAW